MSTRLVSFGMMAGLAAAGCGSDAPELPTSDEGPAPFNPDNPYEPDLDPAQLSPEITNELMPFPVGATWSLEAVGDEGTEVIEIEVLAETREVFGATVRVVRDTASIDGEVIEDTYDWYAQDPDGNVWYMGEDTHEFENGVPVSDAGSWEAGVDGALPGVVMLGDPDLGHIYRQEYLVGEAEDIGEVVSVDEEVTVPAGTFSRCLKTRDRSAVEADLDEFKYYCAGVGNVLTDEGDVQEQLIEYAVP